ncbi:MAG: suppressor of fused domain protein [Emergencia sp.]
MDERMEVRLDQLFDAEAYDQIIHMLENCTQEHDYATILCLARAYNKRGEQGDGERAVQLLEMIRDLGETDPGWYLEAGLAAFEDGRREDAVQAFLRIMELAPEEADAAGVGEFLNMLQEADFGTGENDPEIYEEEELDILEDFITYNFGEYETVFHELVSPDIHVDICIIPPDEERNFYTLTTMGMGAHFMDVPEEFADYALERAELLICLPPDWDLQSEEEKWYWPVRLLKVLARLPVQEDSWLAWGHTVDNGEPFDKSTSLCGCMLINPASFGECENVCILPDNTEVNFYQVIPLYREEMDFKVEHGAQELLDQLDSRVLVVDPERIQFCPEDILS